MINGYKCAEMSLMTIAKGEYMRWYLLTMGEAVNLHTPHWHGSVVLQSRRRTNVIALSPAQLETAEVAPDDQGAWRDHCRVYDHRPKDMMGSARSSRKPHGAEGMTIFHPAE